MTHTPWYQQARHWRDLRDALAAEGFEVIEAWIGRHLRLRVARNGRHVTVTCAGTPSVAEHAINVTMQQARRGTRGQAHNSGPKHAGRI